MVIKVIWYIIFVIGPLDIDQSTITDTASDTNTANSDKLEELCENSTEASVREWLRRAADAQRPRGLPDGSDTWTEIDLDYSSPEEVGSLVNWLPLAQKGDIFHVFAIFFFSAWLFFEHFMGVTALRYPYKQKIFSNK